MYVVQGFHISWLGIDDVQLDWDDQIKQPLTRLGSGLLAPLGPFPFLYINVSPFYTKYMFFKTLAKSFHPSSLNSFYLIPVVNLIVECKRSSNFFSVDNLRTLTTCSICAGDAYMDEDEAEIPLTTRLDRFWGQRYLLFLFLSSSATFLFKVIPGPSLTSTPCMFTKEVGHLSLKTIHEALEIQYLQDQQGN